MATKVKSDYPSSPPNDESEPEPDPEGEEEEPVDEDPPDPDALDPEEPGTVDVKPVSNNVQDILKRLQSTGALLKKPKQEYKCHTCDEDFPGWEDLENHLIQHVSLPSVVLDKLPSDEEDNPPSGDDWSDEEDEAPQPEQKTPQKMPQKIDISQIMKHPGLSIKKPGPANSTSSDSALSKLSGLGFTIKKNSTPIKQENPEKSDSSDEKQDTDDVMQKLGKLGGIKLKLKSDGSNSNSFKVVNGLKDFKTSDDEDDEGEKGDDSGDDQAEKEGNEGESADDQEQADAEKQSDEEDDEEIPLATRKINTAIKNAMKKKLETTDQVKIEKVEPAKKPEPVKIAPKPTPPIKPPGRPAVKQTPRRGANHPLAAKQTPPTQGITTSAASTPERRESNAEANVENVVVKTEVETAVSDTPSSTMPLFSNQIKTERSSPPPTGDTPMSTPIIARVKTENETAISSDTKQEPLFQNNSAPISQPAATTPLLPVTKTEESMTIIEINGDSDGDDDCCVVSATPAPDVKPVIPKTETISTSYATPAYSSSQPSFATTPVLSSRLSAPSTEKQHSFNWNAPDSKPPLDMLEKTTDDLFDSLMSAKRENSSLMSSDAEYISLDTLGPQHCCDVCNTRFTSMPALDEHKRITGHSSSLVAPSSLNSTLLPYSTSSNILSSLLPVKHLADTIGKVGIAGGPGFTHQQNVMINIQAYPGAGGGVMGPPPAYNTYPGASGMHTGFQQPNNMYNPGMPGQQMHGQMPGQMGGQYPGQNYMGQSGFGQYQQPPSSKPGGYPIPTSSPYSTSSPLQGMQQAVYNQSMLNNQMGPPGSSYVPVSSPSAIKQQPGSGVRIQNVQTFAPGQFNAQGQQMAGDMGQMGMGAGQMGMGQLSQPQMPGQSMGNQMPAPGPIRMAAGANITGTRPRMPNVRGVRPTIRPGIQVHGQVRGAKPRMPVKRPAGAPAGPGQKRRNDMLLPGKHDNEDCQVMSMQKQRDGLPMIQSVQGAKDQKLNIGSQISITKKAAPNKSNAMANMLASRGISVKQKPKSRSPSPERPVPHIPNLGSGVSIKHTSKSSNFSIPEAKVGGNMNACKICRKMFMNSTSLAVHMSTVHPSSKVNVFKCDECPASYPKSLQLQHHKRVFHNVQGPNRELGLPVVDLSQEDNIKRLSNLGIYSFIPLANREQAGGCFGIPVISVHNMQNGITNGLQALGADGLLSLGPMKPLPNS